MTVNPALLSAFGLVVHRAFLADTVCERIIAEVDARPGVPATIYDRGSQERLAVDSRRTTAVALDTGTRSELLDEIRAQLVPMGARFGVVPTELRSVGLLRYQAGDYFKRHQDATPGRITEGRLLAFVLMISPDLPADTGGYDGGDFVFYPPSVVSEAEAYVGLNLRLGQGDLAVFEAQSFHEVLPVTAGSRYTVVGWCT